MAEDVMTIRQMCDAFEVTPRTLRFYESKELLFPVREGTRRLFTRRDRARLTLILRGKRFGFALEEIRQLLDLYNVDPQHLTQLNAALEVGRARLHALTEQREQLDDAIGDLRTQLDRGEKRLAEARQPAA